MRGERRTDGLHRIFLWLRSKAPRNSAVRDVGNFVGHKDTRDNGVSWERGVQFCHMAALHLHDRRKPDSVTVDVYKRAVHACFRALGPAAAKNVFKVGYERLGTRLNKALDNIVDVRGGQVVIKRPFTAREQKLLEHYGSRLVVAAAMTESELIDGLVSQLSLQGVLQDDEESQLRAQSCFICAYAITQMHGAELIERGKPVATLAAFAQDFECRMGVHVQYRINGINMVADIFTTDCDPREWCTPAVRTQWVGELPPLELDANGRLSFL